MTLLKDITNIYKRVKCRGKYYLRLLDLSETHSFSDRCCKDRINKIYVINLERSLERWNFISRELKRIHISSELRLFDICKRFSAVDAQLIGDRKDDDNLVLSYSLKDQLKVQPGVSVNQNMDYSLKKIKMSPQEIAIALSHITLWKTIADSDVPYTLILEDDIYFDFGFSGNMDRAWNNLMENQMSQECFDILYLSYVEVGRDSKKIKTFSNSVRKPDTGIWQASGYVLSNAGAKKLVSMLPVYGPVDLWLNLKFDKLNAYIINSPIVIQRTGIPSTNNYSIIPVLSQLDEE